MTAPLVTTYFDAINHLCVWAGALASEAEQDKARAAVQIAYRELYQERKWSYFAKVKRIAVVAPYSTGTVTFDVTGGTYERMVTLASGTWPTWAAYGRIQFTGDDNVYRVSERKSATVITLDAEFCPDADVAALTTYHLDRCVYNLPANCRSIERFHDESKGWQTHFVSPEEYLDLERNLDQSGKPWYWTIMGQSDEYGAMAVHLANRPTAAETLDFLCYVAPRDITFDGYGLYSSQGSARLATATGTAATFTGVSLRTDVVGAMLRLSDTGADKPPGGRQSASQFTEQRIITVRGSITAVTVDSAWVTGFLGTHFTISDPIDLPHFMLGAFEARSEMELANILGDEKRLAVAMGRYERAKREAMARDNIYDQTEANQWPTWESVFWNYHPS
jgi:hypothetical protein